MPSFHFRTAAVIGSGALGGALAALLAGAGVPVLWLDRVPDALTTEEQAAGLTRQHPAFRNRLVAAGLQAQLDARPATFYSAADRDRLILGNLDDDVAKLGDVDWVIEALDDDLAAKRACLDCLAAGLGPHALVTSHTGRLTARSLVEGRPAEFRRRFLGVHFAWPPRSVPLLQLIPTPDTDPALVVRLRDFAAVSLGRGVVMGKDDPPFIADRLGTAQSIFQLRYAVEHGYSVAEVDAIAGPVLGRPPSAVFRRLDQLGVDVLVAHLREAAASHPEDPVAAWPAGRTGELLGALVARRWLGDKTRIGFYKTTRTASGREHWPLDLNTWEHAPARVLASEGLRAARRLADLGQRLKMLVAEPLTDRAAQFAWHSLAFEMSYAAACLPAIADDVASVDNAVRWGLGHALGPFEIWDTLGVAETASRLEASGYPVADWVKALLAAGHTSFYRGSAEAREQFVPAQQAHRPVARLAGALSVAGLHARGRELAGNDEAALLDLGDHILLLEFRGKAYTLGSGVLDLLEDALGRLDDDWEGLVIGHQGRLFSAGANLDLQRQVGPGRSLVGVVSALVRRGQTLFRRLRQCAKPVVAAPFDRTLGGAAELVLAADRIVAHADLAMGLVETSLGLVPAWGGCVEMLRRLVNPVMRVPNADPLPHLQSAFETVGLARVSGSAQEARALGLLTACDRIVFNRELLVAEAKREVLHLGRSGYRPPPPEKVYAVGRDGLALLRLGLHGLREAGQASAHDVVVGEALAFVLCGGDLSEPAWVPVDYVLELERAALVQLIQTELTQARITHMLATGQPLRN